MRACALSIVHDVRMDQACLHLTVQWLDQAGERKAAQMDQSKQWWDEQQQWRAAVDAEEKEAEAAAAELVK
jgi:hypothetical protein